MQIARQRKTRMSALVAQTSPTEVNLVLPDTITTTAVTAIIIAIIAMILPGISGAFILLLMGSYSVVIGTINEFREGVISFDTTKIINAVVKLGTFAIGAILGLKLFSKVLHWMFDNYRNITLSVLTGFMLGSLNKVWPWKKVISTRIDSHGKEVPFMEKSILPQYFDGDNQFALAIILMLLGFLTIFILEKVAEKFSK